MLRSLLRRLHQSERSAAAPAGAASRKLRQRVLSTVRSEAPLYPPARGPTRRAYIPRATILPVLALAITAAAALIASATLPSSRRPRSHVPFSAAAVVRAHATRAQLLVGSARTELVVSRMPQPPIGEIYELWLVRASSPPQPTDALFTVTHAGNGAVQVPGQLRHVREIMVTSEPLGGSSSPTSAAVLRLRVIH
jgi:hypothetical protein